MSTSIVVLGLDGTRTDTVVLPDVFESTYRPDVIHKVYINSESHRYQRQGRYPAAGEIVSAESRNTGLGMARIARARGEGFPRAGQAAGVAGVRHGRLAHPPESWKNIYKKVNKKEKDLALRSAIAATARKELIVKRGHKIGKISDFPILVSDNLESLVKTKDLKKTLINLGLKEDMDRAVISKKARSGTARRRGRKNHVAYSALIVTGSRDAKVRHISGSLPGIHVKSVKQLNILDLAPGSKQIRLTIFSTSAIEELRQLYSVQDRLNKQ
jgi:large subunit ribosomal protein L4e